MLKISSSYSETSFSCYFCKSKENIKKFPSNANLCDNCYQREKEEKYINEKRKTILIPEIDRITDKIFLGNSDAGRDFNKLKTLGITHILIIGSFLHAFYPNDFKYKIIEVEDTEDEDISIYFKDAFQFIDSSSKVLIHCFAGKSRSPSFSIAYLMYKNKKPYSKVYSFVKNKRECIELNNGFKNILIRFNNVLIYNNYILQ